MLKKTFLFFILFQFYLFGSEYAVVVSAQSQISDLTPKQIKDIFMMKRRFLNDTKLIPVNASATSLIREAFEEKILHIERQKLNKYWIRQHFQGVRPPVVQASNQSIELFLQNVDGALSYLPLKNLNPNIKVVYEF